MRHFLDLSAVSKDDLRVIIQAAKDIKTARSADAPRGTPDANPLLKDHVLAMVFDQPSTRTRVSFDMAIRQMGGESMMLTGREMQLGRGETVSDTANVVSRFVDALMIRTLDHEIVTGLAASDGLPVINGLTQKTHPCQLMADILTIEEKLGDIKGRVVAWVGDGNNVCNSYIEAAAQFDFTLRIAHPDGYAPDADVVLWARAQGADIQFVDSVFDTVKDADVVVTDCWVSMGDEEGDRITRFQPYQVNQTVMNDAAAHALFLHCLPAHRGEEVTDEVIDGPQSVVWDEAENRLHAQKAILAWCLNAI